MFKIVKYVLIDLLRSRVVLAYTLLLFLVAMGVFNLEGNATKGVLSLMNIVLVMVPLFSIIFSTIYLYNAAEFIELMASQPLRRINLWMSVFSGLSIAMSTAFLLACGLPILLYGGGKSGAIVLAIGMCITVVFVALAMLASVTTRDKARGIGLSIMGWFYFTVIFDALLLFVLFQFMDYPMETALLVLSMLNPLDLGRVIILLQFDQSVLMGATSTLFRDFFEMGWGSFIAGFVLLLWLIVPFWISLKKFVTRDL